MRWTTMMVAGILALGGALTAHAQAVVPQYTHRGFVAGAVFDDDDARVAVTSSGGFVSILDVASGRVLAVRRLQRSNDSDFSQLALEGPIFRAFASIAGDDPTLVEWNWVEDTIEESEPELEGHLVARSPQGRIVRVDYEGRLRLGRHTEELGRGVTWVAFPHRRVVTVQHRDSGVELLSSRDPSQVLARLRGRGMAFDASRRRVATVDGDHLRIATIPGAQVSTETHGLGLAAKRVVFGPGAVAVVGDDRSELRPAGGERVTVTGSIEWIGRRTMVVRRGTELYRVRRSDGSERRMATGVDEAWVGERGALVFRDEEMDRFTLVRRNGGRTRFAPGGEHSVWHVHASPSGDAVVLAGRFGVQRWSAEGVVDGDCGGEETLAVDWEAGEVLGRYGRCDARGRRRAWPRDAVAMAATADGRVAFLSDGRFFGRAAPRARVTGLPEAICEEVGYCSWYARFEAKGELLVIRTNPDWIEEGANDRVVRTRTGRSLLTVAPGQRILVSADGSRMAVVHERGGVVHDANGRELFRFGRSRTEGDRARSDTEALPVALSADGSRLAWMPREGVVEVLDGSGTPEQRLEVGTRPDFIALTTDALAVGTAGGTLLTRGGETSQAPAGVGLASAVCVEGRFQYLRADLRMARGPACAGGRAERRGELFYRKMGGAVRIWHGGRVATLRALRRGPRVMPLAYTPDGRWWTPAAESEAAAERDAPLAIRRGLESLPAPAEQRDDSLLAEILGAPSRR